MVRAAVDPIRSGAAGVMVTFRLGPLTMALGVESVREVVPLPWLERPPQMPNLVHGILNLAGEAVPVLRLDRLLGLADGVYGIDSAILVMRGHGGRSLGLLVERVEAVQSGVAAQTLALSERESFNGCIVGQCQAGGDVIHILSWPRLLLVEERHRLDQFRQLYEARAREAAGGAA